MTITVEGSMAVSVKVCKQCGKEHQAIGAICGGGNRRFLVYVRPHGHRIWRLVGKPTKSKKVALHRLAGAMAEDRMGWLKRGMRRAIRGRA